MAHGNICLKNARFNCGRCRLPEKKQSNFRFGWLNGGDRLWLDAGIYSKGFFFSLELIIILVALSQWLCGIELVL